MEDAERVRAVSSAIPTALSCTGEQFRFLVTSFDSWRVLLDEECLPSLEVVN